MTIIDRISDALTNGHGDVVVEPPGSGTGFWAGGPSVVEEEPGSKDSAWKDVVVSRDGATWRMWACEHLLDQGDDEADRMRSVYLTSKDGLGWTAERIALGPTADAWDQRGARITSAWESDGKWFASYDGRASAAENWFERTGFEVGATPDEFVPVAGPFEREGRTLRYVTIARTAAGLRLYFETARDDGANDLRTVLVPTE